jgi:hypothetical protein
MAYHHDHWQTIDIKREITFVIGNSTFPGGFKIDIYIRDPIICVLVQDFPVKKIIFPLGRCLTVNQKDRIRKNDNLFKHGGNPNSKKLRCHAELKFILSPLCETLWFISEPLREKKAGLYR